MNSVIREVLRKKAEAGNEMAAIALAIDYLAYQVKCLGTGDAATTMGAMEHLAVCVKDGMNEVASSLTHISDRMPE